MDMISNYLELDVKNLDLNSNIFQKRYVKMSTQDLDTIFLVLESEETAQEIKSFPCQFCEAKFERESSLYGHLNTHRNLVLNCQVENCQQSFSSLKTYRRHVAGESRFLYCHVLT